MARDAVSPLMLDVTDGESVRMAAVALKETLAGKGLDALINNAGITVQGILAFVPPAMFAQQMNKMAFSPKKVSKAVT